MPNPEKNPQDAGQPSVLIFYRTGLSLLRQLLPEGES